jgi:hypothetical protein
MFHDQSEHYEDSLMKTVLSFSILIVCFLSLFLLVPMAGAQEADAADAQEAEAADTQEPSEERIAAEQERLEAKIAELEAKPLEYFGSQKNKRTRIGFYKYRLETLQQDPEKYFSEPEKFEGNVKGSD